MADEPPDHKKMAADEEPKPKFFLGTEDHGENASHQEDNEYQSGILKSPADVKRRRNTGYEVPWE